MPKVSDFKTSLLILMWNLTRLVGGFGTNQTPAAGEAWGFELKGQRQVQLHDSSSDILDQFMKWTTDTEKSKNSSLRRRQSNPLVYTVCVLVHDILFQIRWVARIYIVASDWSKPLFEQTQGRNKPIRSDYIFPCDSAEFETRYRALIRRRLQPLFDTDKPAV